MLIGTYIAQGKDNKAPDSLRESLLCINPELFVVKISFTSLPVFGYILVHVDLICMFFFAVYGILIYLKV